MRKIIIVLASGAFLAGVMLTGCTTSSQKDADSQKNVINANDELKKANKQVLADIEKFRKESAARIAANDQKITELNASLVHEKDAARSDLKKKIAVLEQKNRDLKKAIDEYKADSKENWEIFKSEFNHDMDELGKAFKNIGIRNTI